MDYDATCDFTQLYGLDTTFLILAVFYALVMFPTTFVLKVVPNDYVTVLSQQKAGKKKSLVTDRTWQEMLKHPAFYLLLFALTIGATSGLMVTGHAANIMKEVNHYSVEEAAVFVGFMSIFNSCGRLVFGTLSDKLGRLNTMLLLYLLIGGAMLLLSQVTGLSFVIALFCVTAGYGGFTAMISPVCADFFGMKHLTSNYTFLYLSYGLAGIIGPQVAAYLHQTSGSYLPAFTTVAILCALGIALIAILKYMNHKAKTAKKGE